MPEIAFESIAVSYGSAAVCIAQGAAVGLLLGIGLIWINGLIKALYDAGQP